jgi:hypothetical protein
MTVSNRILVDHGEKAAILRGLTDLFEDEVAPWAVTIRPSRSGPRWTIEISAPGRFWACTAGPGEQDAESILVLIRKALGAGLWAAEPQSQE